MSTQLDITPKNSVLLKVFIDQDPEGQVAATVPVRWCLTPQLLRQLEEQKFLNPQLLIVVRHVRERGLSLEGTDYLEYTDTTYRLVPLASEMTYVNFSRPGRNEICVVIVDMPKTRVDRTRLYENIEEQRSDSLFDHKGRMNRSVLHRLPNNSYLDVNTMLEVVVPREMFAPEPPAWRKTLVRKIFRGREEDQCHFRKRFWFAALPISVVLMIIGVVLKPLAVLVALFFGLRNIPFKRVIQPFELNPIGPLLDAEPSFWYYQKLNNYGSYQPRPKLFWFYSPPFLVIAPLIIHGVSRVVEKNTDLELVGSLFKTYLVAWEMLFVALIVAAILAAALMGTAWIQRRLTPSQSDQEKAEQLRRQKAEDARRIREEQERQRRLRQLQSMTCDALPGDVRVSVDALPKDKQTVYLRFQQVKTAVCKPFAQ